MGLTKSASPVWLDSMQVCQVCGRVITKQHRYTKQVAMLQMKNSVEKLELLTELWQK